MLPRRGLAALAGAALLAACAGPAAPPPRQPIHIPPMPAAQPAQAPLGDGRVTMLEFSPGAATLPEGAAGVLDAAVARLGANPRAVAVVTAPATRQGMALAQERAQAVRQALLDRGVSARRIRLVHGRLGPDAVRVTVR
ncbi:hypothetical protein ACI6QG_17055 [Roseococcus sp. DSY-14]|uniref:hypothetical protein n=1 Tax=Roseococcus sp. DSY-14 TaxID=3369650 RepID=UPI00387AD004